MFKEMATGLGVTLENLFKKPFTVQYPDEKLTMFPRFRGLHILTRHEDGLERCVGCDLCEAACPSHCIKVISAEDQVDMAKASLASAQEQLAKTREALAKNVALAETLGATVVRVRAARPAEGLIAFLTPVVKASETVGRALKRGDVFGEMALVRHDDIVARIRERPGSPVVARYGGEEFAAILPSVDLEESLSLASATKKGAARS